MALMNSSHSTSKIKMLLEILSEREMKAYGWCYSINGEVPEAFPDEVALGPQDKVVWFFAYAHYLAGEWISQCVPVKE